MYCSIIIVNHNTSKVLAECIKSVFKYENRDEFEIIIIDNASKDDSKKFINQLCAENSNLLSVFLDELKSFSYANNLGIKNSKGSFILIMNPDIIFTEPVIKKLAERMENDSNIGAISPALVGSDGNFQRGYFQRYPGIRQFVYYYSILAKFFDGSPKLKNRFLENHEIDITTGKLYFTEQLPFAFFMTTKSVLENIGVLDENFFLFFEDVDLSYRINKKYSLAVDTSVRVTHLGGESFKTEDNWWLYGRLIKSQIYFFEKHYSGMKTLTIKLLAKLNSLAILSFEKIRNPWKKKKQYRQLKHSHFLKLMKED